MKSLQFFIPYYERSSIKLQEEVLTDFYPHFHRHQDIQIMLITKGKGILLIEEQIVPFEDGDMFYIGKNQSHVFRSTADLDIHIETTSIFFDTDSTLKTMFELPEFIHLKTFLIYAQVGLKIGKLVVFELLNTIQKMKVARTEERLFLLFRILNILNNKKNNHVFLTDKPSNSGVLTEADERISKAEEYIQNNYLCSSITLKTIAQQVSLHPATFCRAFKKYTGLTYIEYLNKLRIHHACSLLIQSSQTRVTEVAYSTGFNSITNFNRHFKEIVGYSPKEYKRTFHKLMVNN